MDRRSRRPTGSVAAALTAGGAILAACGGDRSGQEAMREGAATNEAMVVPPGQTGTAAAVGSAAQGAGERTVATGPGGTSPGSGEPSSGAPTSSPTDPAAGQAASTAAPTPGSAITPP